MRLRWKRGLFVCVCVCVCESGTAVFVFNLQTRTKSHPCVHTFRVSRGGTDSRFNEHFKDQLLPRLFSSLCTKSCTYGTEKFIVDGKHFSEATQSAEETFTTAEQLQCPEDIFS